jgi:hypothetical protein
MGALYFGVGKALGGLAGGIAIDQLGDRLTFRYRKLKSIGSLAGTRIKSIDSLSGTGTKVQRLTFRYRN